MSILLPRTAVQGLEADERRRLVDEECLGQARLAAHYTRALRDIDPYLELVFVRQPPGVNVDAPGDIVWNRWHVMRKDPTRTVPDFKPIVGPNGEYMEPHSGVFEQLKEADLWGNDGRERLRKRKLEDVRQRERRAEAEREEMHDEARLRIKAAFNPSINFGGGSWTASKRGRRGRAG